MKRWSILGSKSEFSLIVLPEITVAIEPPSSAGATSFTADAADEAASLHS